MTSYYKHFNGMCWPVASEEMGELEWRLRYSSITEGEKMVVASVMSAYRELLSLPQNKRNEIIKELRNKHGYNRTDREALSQ